MKTSLSVTIITKNEEDRITDCLSSVAGIADEIIVLDSGSDDKTVEICKRYTDKVFDAVEVERRRSNVGGLGSLCPQPQRSTSTLDPQPLPSEI